VSRGASGRCAVPSSAAGERLDRFLLTCLPGQTRSAAQRLVDQGLARVNGAISRPGYHVRAGDEITWETPAPAASNAEPEDIPLELVYEDADLVVINKPKGMVVHPAPGNWSGTLVNALLARFETRLAAAGGIDRPGIVHRLDKDTSGLLVVARNEPAYHSLQRQIQSRSAERRYLAIVRGNPKFERAVVDAPIGRHPQDRKRRAVIPPGSPHAARAAVTELQVMRRFPGYALLEARLQTGRTHQIRVHCAYAGHPVVGDAVYGPERPSEAGAPAAVRGAIQALEGQALHAHTLSLTHPRTGERLVFTVPLPADTQRLLDALEGLS
jgi:23S rRNA pseudouridine1911/1915/1917 synthase